MVIKGKPVNRGGDFSLEVPCEYQYEFVVHRVTAIYRVVIYRFDCTSVPTYPPTYLPTYHTPY